MASCEKSSEISSPPIVDLFNHRPILAHNDARNIVRSVKPLRASKHYPKMLQASKLLIITKENNGEDDKMEINDLFDLSGKVVVVTGAGSGLGKAIAEAVAEAGADVVCADINGETVSETGKLIEKYGHRVLVLQVDVSKEEEVKRMIDETVNNFGRLDVIFNNAGIAGPVKLAHETSIEEWNKVMDVNLTSVFLCCREALKVMVKQKSGKIINTASIWGIVGGGNMLAVPPYTATKGGVISFTKELAVEYGKYGINVNCIAPGFFKTNISRGGAHDPKWKETIRAKTLIHGQAQPEDIKGTAIYLASKASDFVTGHVLVIDDGYLAKA